MALLLKAGQNPLVYTGTSPLVLSTQSWYTSTNVKTIFIPSANNQGFQSGVPGNSFGVTQLPVAALNRRSGLVLVAKVDFSVPDNLFGPLAKPIISSLAPTSVTAGNLINITGTNFDTVAYVLIGGISATITTNAVTSTNVAVTIPLSVTAGSNIPVVVITAGGYSNVVTTLTVSASTLPKLAKPVINTPISVTSSTATFTWALIPGADGYMFRLNGGTVYPLGNVGTYQATGLNSGVAVTGEVYATDSTGTKTNSDYSVLISATTASNGGVQKLPAPSVTTGSPTTSSIPFSWSAVPNATGYQVIINSGAAIPITTASYTATGLSPGVTITIQVRALNNTAAYAASDYSVLLSASTLTNVVSASKYRSLLFDENGDSHYDWGATRTNLTGETPLTYVPPAGTALKDPTIWIQNSEIYFAHSGYVAFPFEGTSLVVGKIPTLDTANPVTASVVYQIDMTVPGRIPALPGYETVGAHAIFSSPSYVLRPNGRAGLFFMYQPDMLQSDSRILYIESLDDTFTSWGNARIITGAAMPYGYQSATQSGSYIDPYYFYYNGEHYLYLRCFTNGNGAGTCLGLRILKSSRFLSGYDTVVLDLYTQAAGGTNPNVTAQMEGQAIYLEENGTWTNMVDDFTGLGYVFANSLDGLTNPAAFANLQQVGKPTGATYNLRHGDMRDLIHLPPVIQDDDSTVVPTVSIATQKGAETGTDAAYSVTLTSSVAPFTDLPVQVQEIDGSTTQLITLTIPAGQTSYTVQRSTARTTTDYSYILAVQAGVRVQVDSAAGRATFNVNGTQPATGKPVATIQTIALSTDSSQVKYVGRISFNQVLSSAVVAHYTTSDATGATTTNTLSIPAGQSQVELSGVALRAAATYTATQALQADSVYDIGASGTSSLVISAWLTIENDAPGILLVGNWQTATDAVNFSGGTLSFLQNTGLARVTNFLGGTLEIYNPKFSGITVSGAIYVNDLFIDYMYYTGGASNEPSQLVYTSPVLPAGTLEIRHRDNFDLHLDKIRIR